MHGKTSRIHHDGEDLFAGLPVPFEATRYHSLIVEEPLPKSLKRTATTEEGELMGLRHRELPIFGVQFHPESILTPEGKRLLRNFLEIDHGHALAAYGGVRFGVTVAPDGRGEPKEAK
jgi:anthranilate synthase/aminodeoxychorismate synthase-like glutamine amidotransferase